MNANDLWVGDTYAIQAPHESMPWPGKLIRKGLGRDPHTVEVTAGDEIGQQKTVISRHFKESWTTEHKERYEEVLNEKAMKRYRAKLIGEQTEVNKQAATDLAEAAVALLGMINVDAQAGCQRVYVSGAADQPAKFRPHVSIDGDDSVQNLHNFLEKELHSKLTSLISTEEV